ncbi:MAG: leucine-rich repeat domain-containing protein [Clostridia bacterium]|nr:leucine-rich repeat domain-containing protein [Clostridia bacterium]
MKRLIKTAAAVFLSVLMLASVTGCTGQSPFVDSGIGKITAEPVKTSTPEPVPTEPPTPVTTEPPTPVPTEPPTPTPVPTEPPTPEPELPDSFLFGGVTVVAGQTAVKVAGKQNALIRITPEEMDMLIRLCPNLTTLTLNYCCMADYSRIGELTKLRNLMISTTTHSMDPGIPLVDIDWMASLKDLRTLYLAYNKIEDIRVLAGLTKLEELNLGWNNISDSDLNYLTGLPLRLLYLYCDSSLRDVSALSNIRSLELLHIGGNKKLRFSGIKKLTNLSHLKELDISYCPVEDFEWIRDFKSLETLRIEYSEFIDFYAYYDLAASETLQTVVISREDTDTEEALRAMIRDCKSDIEIVYWEDYK